MTRPYHLREAKVGTGRACHCNTLLQHNATHCSISYHLREASVGTVEHVTATHYCNTPQHITTHCNTSYHLREADVGTVEHLEIFRYNVWWVWKRLARAKNLCTCTYIYAYLCVYTYKNTHIYSVTMSGEFKNASPEPKTYVCTYIHTYWCNMCVHIWIHTYIPWQCLVSLQWPCQSPKPMYMYVYIYILM